MVRRFAILLMLALLLSTLPAIAEECATFERNICSVPNFDTRVQEANDALDRYYSDQGVFTTKTRARFPAALHYLQSENSVVVDDVNTFLDEQLDEDIVAKEDMVYLAWLYTKYQEKLSPSVKTKIVSKIGSDYNPGTLDNDETDYFLKLVTDYIMNDDKNTAKTPNLAALLRSRGKNGWHAEENANDLARVIVGLAALYDEADKDARNNKLLFTLSEANLDILFARFAALESNGQFGGMHAGFYPEASTYNMEQNPWYGWAKLYFGETSVPNHFVEPGLLQSGYCIHDAVRSLNAYRLSSKDVLRLKETLSNNGKSYAYITPDWVLSSTVDLTHRYQNSDGFLNRLSIQYRDETNPNAYIYFNRLTSPDRSAPLPQEGANDGGAIFVDDDYNSNPPVVLGNLGGSNCAEPHILIGDGFDVEMVEGVDLILLRHGNDRWALRIFGDFFPDGMDRYKPLSRYIPNTMTLSLYDPLVESSIDDSEGLYSRGLLIMPFNKTYGNLFSLQYIPPTYTGDYFNIMDDTRLSYDKSTNQLVYITNISVTNPPFTYRYKPSALTGSEGVTGSYTVRNIRSDYKYFEYVNPVWTVQGLLGVTPYSLNLDFTANVDEIIKPGTNGGGTMGCVDGVQTGGEPTIEEPLDTAEKRLAFLAASMIQGQTGDYTLDCGKVDEVLPAYDPLMQQANGVSLIDYACVLQRDKGRTIGLVYNPGYSTDTRGAVEEVLARIAESMPYASGEGDAPTPPSTTLCDAHVGETEDLSFAPCDNFEGTTAINAWISAPSKTMVFSDDTDPFTSGNIITDVLNFFRSLFGGVWGDATNPEETGAFKAGFFSATSGSGKTLAITATKNGNTAEFLFSNFAIDLQPLVEALGSTTTRKANNEQSYRVSGVSPSEWAKMTRELRLVPMGSALSFGEPSCGDGIIQPGEECDIQGGETGEWKSCADGSGNFNICLGQDQGADKCTIDNTPCETCNNDGDPEECADDCFDHDPHSLAFANIQLDGKDCTSSDFDIDVDCLTPPLSTCPQCRYHGGTEVCDGVDNNCVSSVDEGCPGQTGGDDAFACDDVSADCPNICVTHPPNPLCFNCGSDGRCNNFCPTITCNLEPDPDCVVVPHETNCQGYGQDCVNSRDCDTNPDPRILSSCVDGCCKYTYYCFLSGTRILTPTGEKPIEELLVGDAVIAYDEASGEQREARITKNFVFTDRQDAVRINDEIEVTVHHPFYTLRGWVEAGKLTTEDKLLSSSGAWIAIHSIDPFTNDAPVYNMAVEPYNTYYADDVLVHNKAAD